MSEFPLLARPPVSWVWIHPCSVWFTLTNDKHLRKVPCTSTCRPWRCSMGSECAFHWGCSLIPKSSVEVGASLLGSRALVLFLAPCPQPLPPGSQGSQGRDYCPGLLSPALRAPLPPPQCPPPHAPALHLCLACLFIGMAWSVMAPSSPGLALPAGAPFAGAHSPTPGWCWPGAGPSS